MTVTKGPKVTVGKICTTLAYSFSSDLCLSMQRFFHLNVRNTGSLHVLFKKSRKWLQMSVLPETQHSPSVSHALSSNSCPSKVGFLAGCQRYLYFNISAQHLT